MIITIAPPYELSPLAIHSIRTDKKERWKKGQILHLHNENGERKSTVNVCSVQKFEVRYVRVLESAKSQNTMKVAYIFIDGRKLEREEIEELAMNEGYKNIIHFSANYMHEMKGKLVHWTKKKY